MLLLMALLCFSMDWTIITHCIQHSRIDYVDIVVFIIMTVIGVFSSIGSVVFYKELKEEDESQ
jgi:hypothetical protein